MGPQPANLVEDSIISTDDRIPFSEIEQRGQKLLEQLREFNPDLTYDDASIEWLEGFAQRNRDVFSEEGRYGVAIGFGFVLGEVMIRTIGGKWEYDEKIQEWLVAIGDPVGKANPIGKAYKLLSDDFQSMVSLLRITRLVKETGGWDKIGTRLGSDEVRDNS